MAKNVVEHFLILFGPRFACRILGHDWRELRSFTRDCARCGAHSWLGENPYPDVGEPKYSWSEE